MIQLANCRQWLCHITKRPSQHATIIVIIFSSVSHPSIYGRPIAITVEREREREREREKIIINSLFRIHLENFSTVSVQILSVPLWKDFIKSPLWKSVGVRSHNRSRVDATGLFSSQKVKCHYTHDSFQLLS